MTPVPELGEEETPVAVLDLERVRANARKVARWCREQDLKWRPHVKTHKSTRIARIQLDAGATGLTVATPFEAEVMARACDDLLLAYPPVGTRKLDRLMELPSGVRLTVGLDSEAALVPLSEAARAAGRTVAVLAEVDVGMGRVGVTSEAEAVGLARRIRELEGVAYAGIMFYPGHIRVPAEEQGSLLRTLNQRLRGLYQALDREGLAPEVVSGGSSPTLWQSHRIEGLTEIRPGTCIFYDRDMVELGVADAHELGYTVLATVVSTAVPGQAVIDAGSKALSKEVLRSAGGGYGVLLDRPEVTVSALSEEHGTLDLSRTDWRPQIGDRVRVVPNHVCVSVNLQDRYAVVEADGAVECWPVEARGRI